MKQRILPFVLCALTIGLCLGYARYRGNYSPWWNAHGGGIPYDLFWIIAAYLIGGLIGYIVLRAVSTGRPSASIGSDS